MSSKVLSKKSQKMFLLNQVRGFLKELILGDYAAGGNRGEGSVRPVGQPGTAAGGNQARSRTPVDAIRGDEAVGWKASPSYRDDGPEANKVPERREEYLNMTATGLNIIGRAGYVVFKGAGSNERLRADYFGKLARLDWRKASPFWTGTVITEGAKVATHRDPLNRAFHRVHKEIGIPLEWLTPSMRAKAQSIEGVASEEAGHRTAVLTDALAVKYGGIHAASREADIPLATLFKLKRANVDVRIRALENVARGLGVSLVDVVRMTYKEMSKSGTKRERKFSVVGLHAYELATEGPDGASYVEWVNADTPEAAARKAQTMHPDRVHSIVIAVFRGHRIDRLFNKGLMSGDDCVLKCSERLLHSDMMRRLAAVDLDSIDSNDEEHDVFYEFIEEARRLVVR